ncbi:hypothetical protein VTJ83DRAFT_6242 [Remersonia thermophila]|uniref:Early meiotic induction protein 1 n=1 Tax=Remersonia thermophila TaxID=72144 RepID=A0ABR4D6G0_9PEZI
MGWLWSSSPPANPSEGSSSSSSSSSSSAPTPTPPAAPTQTQAPSPKTESSSDQEVAMFMQMLIKDTNNSSSSSSSSSSTSQPQTTTTTTTPPSSQPSSSPSSPWTSFLPWPFKPAAPEPSPTTTAGTLTTPLPPRRERSPQSLAMSEHTYPTTMSCRDAFDYAWHCHTPGAQWNAVYRYGSVRPCTELWDDFWFCMRTRTYPPDARAEAVREHYRAKEARKYGGGRPSSEDVWESRDERVAPGTAFRAAFEPPIADDDEFRREDFERRRRVQEAEGARDGNAGGQGEALEGERR